MGFGAASSSPARAGSRSHDSQATRPSPRCAPRAQAARVVWERRQAPPAQAGRCRFPTRCSSGGVVASASPPVVRPGQPAVAQQQGLAAVARPSRRERAFGAGVRALRPRPRLLRSAGAPAMPPGTRSRQRRLRRTPRRRLCVHPPATRRSRSWLRPPARASGSASTGRRWCPPPPLASGTSSSPIPRLPRAGWACPSRQGRPPPPRQAPAARGAPSRSTRRPKAGRNRPKRPRTALSRSRRWSGGGSSTHRPGGGRRKR